MRFSSEDADDMKRRMASKAARTWVKDNSPTLTTTPSPAPSLVAPKGAPPSTVMNKTESAYAARLEILRRAGEIVWYAYEGVTLKLAHDCRYTPDFVVMRRDGGIELHEVKGFMRGDAAVKLRVAAKIFPFPVYLARKAVEPDGWVIEQIKGG